MDAREIHPIRQQRQARARHALGRDRVQHPGRDRRDPIEAPQDRALQSKCRADGAGMVDDAKPGGGVDLEVLDMQPRLGAGEARSGQRRRRRQQGRRDGHHQIGPLKRYSGKQRRQARRREGAEVQDAAPAGDAARHIERAADDSAALPALALPNPVAPAAAAAPFRVIRAGRNDGDGVALGREPGRHLARIASDAGDLRREIDPDDENTHGVCAAPEITGVGRYTGEMAAWLAAEGHAVTVVATRPYYPEWRRSGGWRHWIWQSESRQGCRVIRCPLYVPRRVTGWRRVLHLGSFAASSLPALLARVALERPDLVMAVAPTLLTQQAALAAARLAGAKAWLHVQDLEIDAAAGLGVIDHAGAIGAALRLERAILRRFDRVSAISPRMLDAIAASILGEI